MTQQIRTTFKSNFYTKQTMNVERLKLLRYLFKYVYLKEPMREKFCTVTLYVNACFIYAKVVMTDINPG
jgi:hypothetical protein